jgi:short-subunit dehydrogenase
MDLKQKHVVVTGASAGIGRALALELARAGARLTLVARRRVALERLAAEIEEEALSEPLVLAVDLSEGDDGWLDEAREHAGPIDVLINNAGVQVIAPTHSVDVRTGERLLELNLRVPLRLTRRVLPSMLARGEGGIVNVASMAALAPTPGMTYYNAAKAGLGGASEALRGELRDSGVDVVTVYPGIIETDMARAGISRYEPSALLRMQPVGDADVLARLVRRALERRRARIVYPRVNVLARFFPTLTRWVMDRFTPRLASRSPQGQAPWARRTVASSLPRFAETRRSR